MFRRFAAAVLLLIATAARAGHEVNVVSYDGDEHPRRPSAQVVHGSEAELLKSDYARIGTLWVRHRARSAASRDKGTVGHLLDEAAAVGGDAVVVTEANVQTTDEWVTVECMETTTIVEAGTFRTETKCTGGYEDVWHSVPVVRSAGDVYRRDPKLASAGRARLEEQVRVGNLGVELQQRIDAGDVNRVRTLVGMMPSRDQRLEWAVRAGQSDLAKDELDGGVAPLPYHLWLAAGYGDVDTVRVLLDAGLDANEPYGETTPVLRAIVEGRAKAAKFLVERGARVDVKARAADADPTPLHEAVRLGDVDLVAFLFDHGARLTKPYRNFGSPELGDASRTPRNLALLELLVSKGAKVAPSNSWTVAVSRDLEMIRFVMANGGDAAHADLEHGLNALHNLTQPSEFRGHPGCASAEILAFYVERGADPDLRSTTGKQTPIGLAKQHCPDLVAVLEGRQPVPR